MSSCHQDPMNVCRTLYVDGIRYTYYSLEEYSRDIRQLPYSLKVLLENLLRFEDGHTVTTDDIMAIVSWPRTRRSKREIAYHPARVLMQDFTGVPAIVDLAAMREAMADAGEDPKKINPLIPVDLVIDHSVTVDSFGKKESYIQNISLEFQRNEERYAFLRWGQTTFDNFRVVPPGTGICHQVNLEHLSLCVCANKSNTLKIAYPDTVVGTDSHTTMVNGLAVLGWGVGGIEAESAMLGQPVSMLIPEVVGVRLQGSLPEGVTATDLVLAITERLRQKGVVGKFVEFCGSGLDSLSLPDRATIANMAPEYGATCGFFPIDRETINYLSLTGRDPHQVKLVESYARIQGMWRGLESPEPLFTDILELDLSTIEPSLAGPRRPQERVALSAARRKFLEAMPSFSAEAQKSVKVSFEGKEYVMSCGDVVIAAITSCTNTSNPSVMIAAGLLARKAVEQGLSTKPWVKTSLAPGSQVITDYLTASGLQFYLNKLGFNVVGYGCTTCIGNAGPLADSIVKAIESKNLVTVAVLSGNRNFEGRISPYTRANYLASPPLVIAYALSGSIMLDLTKDPLGTGTNGVPIFLKDIWPSTAEIQETLAQALTAAMFRTRYADVFTGPTDWQVIERSTGVTYAWEAHSTYVRRPPYFQDFQTRQNTIDDVIGARCLALLGDSVTTDHISPAGSIRATSPAGLYLQARGISSENFNSYGARRGNHEIMMRGTFANIRLSNEMVPNVEGGMTRHEPSGSLMSIYDASILYKRDNVKLLIIAGKEYGTGSSRDWAAKGPALLGVKAIIAESFERIHRSNLIGVGILPLQFQDGENRRTLRLDGSEHFAILGLADLTPLQDVTVMIYRTGDETTPFTALCRIDTIHELEYYRHGGILPYTLRRLLKKS